MKDYYKILGLNRSASISEIRKAYRKLALKFHPDTNQSDMESDTFILINEAYNVLRNVSSKVRYDKLYDHYILKKNPGNSVRFNSRENARNSFVNKRSAKGRAKGNNYAHKSRNDFQRQTKRSGFWDGFSSLLEFFGYLLEVFV